ncbi:MAG: MarR family transcriptional regulator [Candidatus Thermoplasmatota archaeon]|nr:MarR family transcriptional regulator [Candidatus Thermoplasmatota archaeon]
MISSQVNGLTPSCRLVLRVLSEIKISDLSNLERETGLPRRTLLYAIARLKEKNLIQVQVCLNDSRRRYYCFRIGNAMDD